MKSERRKNKINHPLATEEIKHDDFLTAPEILSAHEDAEEIHRKSKIPRESASYQAKNDEFIIKVSQNAQQFFKIYSARLQRIRPVLIDKVKAGWNEEENGPLKIQTKILNAQEGESCVIVGTIFKDVPLKPNVLHEYTKERAILPIPPRESYISEKDSVFLEDETGRTKLQGIAFQINDLVTGMIVAVRGQGIEDGEFEAYDIILPGLAPQKPFQPKCNSDKYVALVSGLNIGADGVNPLYNQLLVDYLTGHLGSKKEHEHQSRIVRLILAGNSICTENEEKTVQDNNVKFSKVQQRVLTQSVTELDRCLLALCASIPVDIMPGEKDPANITFPQQPINRCLLRQSSKLNTLIRTTNPHYFVIEGVSFLGHSGQPIDTTTKYMDVPSRLEFMEKCLQLRHMTPSTPDIMYGFPSDNDPFIFEETPRIFLLEINLHTKLELSKGKKDRR